MLQDVRWVGFYPPAGKAMHSIILFFVHAVTSQLLRLENVPEDVVAGIENVAAFGTDHLRQNVAGS